MKTILVPTDFSVHARNAMKHAINLADALHAEVIFFHCTNAPVSRKLLKASESEKKKIMNLDVTRKTLLLAKEIRKVYDQLNLKRQLTGTKAIVKSGLLVVEEILDVAKSNEVDLIVAGTHGVSGAKTLFGSNASNLISKSNIPVMVIPQKYRYRPIVKIIYSSDLKNPLQELKLIIPFAEIFNATVDVFNLCYEETKEPEKFFGKLVTQVMYPHLRLIQLRRDPDKTILRQLRGYIEHYKPDLLVMFPAERDLLHKIFDGSKTEKLSYSIKMPLLSIKKN